MTNFCFRKIPRDRGIYRRGYPRITETPEDSDDRSVSDCSRTKVYAGNQFDDLTVADNSDKNRRLITTSQNSIFPSRQQQSSPSELTSFIARQEEYIEQLEQESRYCKDELKNLLEKIREVCVSLGWGSFPVDNSFIYWIIIKSGRAQWWDDEKRNKYKW